jgi:hypothetical protein
MGVEFGLSQKWTKINVHFSNPTKTLGIKNRIFSVFKLKISIYIF